MIESLVEEFDDESFGEEWLNDDAVEEDNNSENKAIALRMMNSGNRNKYQDVSSVDTKIRPVYAYWSRFRNKFSRLCSEEEDGGEPVLTKMNHKGKRIIDWPKMRAFVDYCDNHEIGMTFTTMNNVCYFLKTLLFRECHVEGCGQLCQKGIVLQDASIKAVQLKYLRSRAVEALREFRDMIAGIEVDIPWEKVYKMSKEVFQPTCNETAGICDLGRIQAYTQMVESMSSMRRGEDLRCGSFAMQFVKSYAEIGRNGSIVDMVVRNKGKTNKTGKREASGHTVSVNPARDFAAWQGFCFIWRFVVLMEPFPDILNSEALHCRPLYRSINSYKDGIDYTTQSKQYKKMFRSQRVVAEKVTHHFRGQSMREMDRHEIDHTKISRLAGTTVPGAPGQKQNRVQVNHYMTNPPVDALVERGGGDPKNPMWHNPPWASVEVPEDVIDELCPFLTKQWPLILRAQDACEGKKKSLFKEMQRENLFQAEGAYRAIENKLKRALLMFAARPVDMKGRLLEGGRPPYQEFSDFPLFKISFFRGQRFLELASKVQRAQESEVFSRINMSMEAIDVLQYNVHNVIWPLVEGQMTRITNMYDGLQSSIKDLESRFNTAAQPRLVQEDLSRGLGQPVHRPRNRGLGQAAVGVSVGEGDRGLQDADEQYPRGRGKMVNLDNARFPQGDWSIWGTVTLCQGIM